MAGKTLFISDLHLGARSCRSDKILQLLDKIKDQPQEIEAIYIVGDFIDCWKLRNRWYWPAEHNKIIRKLLGFAGRGTSIYWLTGNHDRMVDFLIDSGVSFGNIKLANELIFVDDVGRNWLVIHGDKFDAIIRYFSGSRLLQTVADMFYSPIIWISRLWQRLTGSKWSLSKWLKTRTKDYMEKVSNYREMMQVYAEEKGCYGVIAGHTHTPEMGERYINCGDWIESCSYVLYDKKDGFVLYMTKKEDKNEKV